MDGWPSTKAPVLKTEVHRKVAQVELLHYPPFSMSTGIELKNEGQRLVLDNVNKAWRNSALEAIRLFANDRKRLLLIVDGYAERLSMARAAIRLLTLILTLFGKVCFFRMTRL